MRRVGTKRAEKKKQKGNRARRTQWWGVGVAVGVILKSAVNRA